MLIIILMWFVQQFDYIRPYKVEYNFELHWKYFLSWFSFTSSACYAFVDYDTCRKVSDKHDLRTVRKFKLVESPINKIVKVDMEIISERFANRVSMQKSK
jgi:hypothetical protein